LPPLACRGLRELAQRKAVGEDVVEDDYVASADDGGGTRHVQQLSLLGGSDETLRLGKV